MLIPGSTPNERFFYEETKACINAASKKLFIKDIKKFMIQERINNSSTESDIFLSLWDDILFNGTREE